MTPTVPRTWFKATLTPAALGIFTDGFYPKPKKRTGAQYVFFTQEDVTPAARKVIVASKFSENGIRILTQDLAIKCLIPTNKKATRAEATKLDTLASRLKL
jgi:hypothetical protein